MEGPLRLEWREPRELSENPKNWRRHPSAQANALREVLADLGWAGAVLYNERTGRLIDGHLRKNVAKKGEKIPVLVGSWTEEQENKILLTLDPLAGMAQADTDRLTALLETVHIEDAPAVNELLAGIADQWLPISPEAEIQDPEAPIDRAAELQAKWSTARGQLWRITSHQILCGDCTKEREVMRLWSDRSPRIREIWTDPPYGIDYVRTKNAALQHLHKGTRVKTSIANDSLSPEQTHALFRSALTLASQRAHKGASCYATVASGPLLVGFIRAFEAAGFSFKHHLVWVKQQMVLGRCDYHYRHEPILYGWLENGPHYFSPDRTSSTRFRIRSTGSPRTMIAPTR